MSNNVAFILGNISMFFFMLICLCGAVVVNKQKRPPVVDNSAPARIARKSAHRNFLARRNAEISGGIV